MKKLLFVFAILLGSSSIFAQLNESFEGNVFPPSGWTKQSPDGGTGWRVDTLGTAINGWTGGVIDVPVGGGNQLAFISYIDGGPASNDAWLITPQITPATGEYFTFYLKNFFTTYADTIDIMLSNTTSSISSFSTNLLTIGNCPGIWTKYNINLSAYINQPIYIAFREHVSDNQNDGAAIGLDLVKKEIPVTNDLSLVSLSVPTGIVYPGNIILKAKLLNLGTQVQAAGKVISFYNGSSLLGTVLTSNSIPMGGVDSVVYTWNNVGAGGYLLKAISPTDQDTINNFANAQLTVFPAGGLIESFENITQLPSSGWSNPGDSWLLGTNPVNAYEGTQYAYLAANLVDKKLITPKLQVTSGDSISFMAYSLATTANPNVKVQYSTDKMNWIDISNANYTLSGVYMKYTTIINFSGSYYFAFVGTNNSTASLRLDFIVAPAIVPTINIAATQLITPSTACMLTNNEQVSAVVTNTGLLKAFNFQISYKKNNQQPVTEIFTDTVLVGAYKVYNFTTKVDLSVAGTDSIRIWVSHIADDDHSNDTLAYTSISNLQALNIPLSIGFEAGEDLSGWILQNMNGDGNTWGLGNTSGLSNAGTNYAVYNYSSTSSADDWLISRCYNISTTQHPYLSFYYRAMQDYPEKMKVYLMTSTNINDTIIKLVDLSNITNVTYNQSVIPFSVPASGTYYIGFHAYSNADMWRLLLDDIVIGIDAGVNEINKNFIFNVFPNPSKDLVNFSSNITINQIELYNSIGQKLIDAKPNSYIFQINTSVFAKGIYFVKSYSKQGITTSKVVID